MAYASLKILTAFIFFPVCAFSQTDNPSKAVSVVYLSNPAALARKNIADCTVHLIIKGGWGHVVYPGDAAFEKQYHLSYRDPGCTGNFSENDAAYNRVVFQYLKEKYGEKWMKLIRKDVAGFNDWKNHH